MAVLECDILDPDGTETRSVYDASGRVIWQTDEFKPVNSDASSAANVSLVTHTLYDSSGNAYRTERYSGVAIPIVADTTAGVAGIVMTIAPSPSDVPLSYTQNWYDDQNRVIESRDAAGLRTGTIYDASGNVALTGPLKDRAPDGGRSAAAAGAFTVAFATSDLASSTSSLTQQPNATTVSTLPWFNKTTYPLFDRTVDARGYQTDTYTSADGLTTYTVFADNSFTETVRSRGDQAVEDYSAFIIPAGGSQTVSIAQRKTTNDDAEATIRIYDRAGNLTDVYLPEVPDALNGGVPSRPRWVYTYDASGNELTQTDPKGHVTTFAYDENGNRVARTLPPDSDGNTGNDTERWTYDANGRILTHIDFKSQTERDSYDDSATGDGRLKEKTFYNAGNNFVDRADANLLIDYSYDSLGRKAKVAQFNAFDDSAPFDFTQTTYDPITGGVSEVDSPEGTIYHSYNTATGQLSRTWTANNDTSYDYDAEGRLWHVTVNKLNGVSLTPAQVTTYVYDPAGNLLTTTEDEGTASTSDDIVTTETYDDLDRLDTLTETRGGTDVFTQDFSYTADSQKNDVLEKRYNANGSVFSTVRTKWTYDNDDRLTGETRDEGDDQAQNGGDYTDTFTYDLNGNRISMIHDVVGTTQDSATTSAYNDRDELMSETTNGVITNLTYDPNGSTLTDGTTSYAWNLQNQMASVTVSGVKTSYAYDANGVRVSKGTGTQTTNFLNDDQNPTGYAKPIEESINGTLSRSYVIGQDVLAQVDLSGETTILRDGRGYARTLIESTGFVLQSIDVDAFGDILNNVNPNTPFESPDGYYDADTKNYYQLARYRQKARFLSADGLISVAGEEDNANIFNFAASNPITSGDPSGHLAELLTSIGIGASLIGISTVGILAGVRLLRHIFNSYGLINKTEVNIHVVASDWSEGWNVFVGNYGNYGIAGANLISNLNPNADVTLHSNGVADMVSQIQQWVQFHGNPKIKNLVFRGHGSEYGFYPGSTTSPQDSIDNDIVLGNPRYSATEVATVAQLNKLMAPDSAIRLEACYAGLNKAMLQSLANLTGASVTGGTSGDIWNNLSGNWVTAVPGGSMAE